MCKHVRGSYHLVAEVDGARLGLVGRGANAASCHAPQVNATAGPPPGGDRDRSARARSTTQRANDARSSWDSRPSACRISWSVPPRAPAASSASAA